MKTMFTDHEYQHSKSNDKLPLKCYNCGAIFRKKKSFINLAKQSIDGRKAKYCSKLCQSLGARKGKTVGCLNCGKYFYKTSCELKKTPNSFCGRSCAASYNNSHKKYGFRVSKFESWIQKKLPETFPEIEFTFNNRKVIGLELDLFLPDNNMAIEFNGIVHYKPIFGIKEFNRIIRTDRKKRYLCKRNGIQFHVINISHISYSVPKNFVRPFRKVVDIIVGVAGLAPAALAL